MSLRRLLNMYIDKNHIVVLHYMISKATDKELGNPDGSVAKATISETLQKLSDETLNAEVTGFSWSENSNWLYVEIDA